MRSQLARDVPFGSSVGRIVFPGGAASLVALGTAEPILSL